MDNIFNNFKPPLGMRYLDTIFASRIKTVFSNADSIERHIRTADQLTESIFPQRTQKTLNLDVSEQQKLWGGGMPSWGITRKRR